MNVILRLEEEKDYRAVENLTREAFWNVYKPGADEHLVLRNMRNSDVFVRELDFIAIFDNEIAGNIVYAKAKVIHTAGEHEAAGEHEVLTFGPLSVLPKYQKNGIGRKLIEHTIAKSKETGFEAIIIYGNPAYYGRFGFMNSKKYGITDTQGNYNDALLALELMPGALKNANGKFFEGEVYDVSEEELEKFEKNFPYKEKLVLDTQIFKA
jgi:predicted N-acetyltransferase YhbS